MHGRAGGVGAGPVGWRRVCAGARRRGDGVVAAEVPGHAGDGRAGAEAPERFSRELAALGARVFA